ncbi:hypothetical protein TURU_162478 [Turdus rufiventris]|nr:hypothetical protein TURU_162478 [Turdus rufiventris]
MAAERRLAYDAEFKLKAIVYAEGHGNRPAAREFSINDAWYADGDSRRTNFLLQERQRRVSVAVNNAIKSTKIDGEDMGNLCSVLLGAPIAQLCISNMEDEEFEGFMEDEAIDEAADE